MFTYLKIINPNALSKTKTMQSMVTQGLEDMQYKKKETKKATNDPPPHHT